MELHPSPRLEAAPTPVTQQVRLPLAPPIRRTPMAPARWPIPLGRPRTKSKHEGAAQGSANTPSVPGPQRGFLRRAALLVLICGQSALATWFMQDVLGNRGGAMLQALILTLFALLFLWVSAGFWTAIIGFVQLLRQDGGHTLSARDAGDTPIPDHARTAIVVPICDENVERVFAGVEATFRSLRQTGEDARFDVFLLSDSNDPDLRVAEIAAWSALCRKMDAFGRIFYRWRRHRIKHKSGNIGDFCRRWGANYRYMLILDADSVMSGHCLTTLVRMMERLPEVGILQTTPNTAGRDTLYARIQQFANRVYGPLFAAGLHFWQLGESHYWGHNAIVRVAPFMRHCALPRLKGRGLLSGEILSHDFVEAALMRRSGWDVWLVYDLGGSYEESPPNLVDELKRDRRWCQGNLMNFRLFAAPGIHPVHRTMFLTGVMAYLSSPLWLLFIGATLGLLATHSPVDPGAYFHHPHQLFPLWPRWNPQRGLELFTATATLLFAPKILATLLVLLQGAKRFGGGAALVSSVVLESVFSALMAPVKMLFHSGFVLAALSGRYLRWKSPPREDVETTWPEALRRHSAHTVFALACGGGAYRIDPACLWWLLPVVCAVVLSAPLSVLTSRARLGRLLRRLRLFLIPEETDPPKELAWTRSASQHPGQTAGFVDAIRNPFVNALLRTTAPLRQARADRLSPLRQARADRLSPLLARAFADGPGALSIAEKHRVLNNPAALCELHRMVATLPAAHGAWHGGASG
ncbi:MAG: glucans biosynthesis glucosyltransferase MdoH [Rhodocyclaceae bacterium]|nr:MAG: glucans biosynthesis glucosyltransferase MdoH [Rhodocyclaceae bacterium]